MERQNNTRFFKVENQNLRAFFKSQKSGFLLSLILTLFWISCRQDSPVSEILPELTPYPAKMPSNFPPANLKADNPLTVEGVELGRMLYYDKALHPNQTMACANCHLQKQSFSIANMDGVLPHVNLAWKRHYLWNGKIKGTLEDAMMFEVNEFFASDLRHIKSNTEYQRRFKMVFGSDRIDSKRTAYALAQFIASLISSQSKYDLVVSKKAVFTPSEARGEELFFSEKGDCFHCHAPPLFSDMSFHNTGIDSVFEGRNRGRFEVTGKAHDIGLMSTPTLRNIAVTAPYMHDGRFENLEDVIEHYNAGVKRSATLDPLMLKNDSDGKKHFTQQDKDDLKAFLLTLTDTSFLNNSQYSSPF